MLVKGAPGDLPPLELIMIQSTDSFMRHHASNEETGDKPGIALENDDAITWKKKQKHYWPFLMGIHRSPWVPLKKFSLLLAWTNNWYCRWFHTFTRTRGIIIILAVDILDNILQWVSNEHHSVLAHMKGPHYWPFVKRIQRWPVDSHHKGPVMRKTFPCLAVIIKSWTGPTAPL